MTDNDPHTDPAVMAAYRRVADAQRDLAHAQRMLNEAVEAAERDHPRLQGDINHAEEDTHQ